MKTSSTSLGEEENVELLLLLLCCCLKLKLCELVCSWLHPSQLLSEAVQWLRGEEKSGRLREEGDDEDEMSDHGILRTDDQATLLVVVVAFFVMRSHHHCEHQ